MANSSFIKVIFLRQWEDGTIGTVGTYNGEGGFTLKKVSEDKVQLLGREAMRERWDANCCPSYNVEVTFEGDMSQLRLTKREIKILPNGSVAQNLNSPERYSKITNEFTGITLNDDYSLTEKVEKYIEIQKKIEKAILTEAIRMIPIYDLEDRKFYTLDAIMKKINDNVSGNSRNIRTLFERDPVGETLSLFFDSSDDNIFNMFDYYNYGNATISENADGERTKLIIESYILNNKSYYVYDNNHSGKIWFKLSSTNSDRGTYSIRVKIKNRYAHLSIM